MSAERLTDGLRTFLDRAFYASARRLGFEAFPRKSDHHYVPNYYGRTAHKHLDVRSVPVFGDLARQSVNEGRCLLYYDRLYTIFQAVSRARRFSGPLNFAEVGVFRGGTSRFIASVAEKLNLPAVHHAFDTFEGHAAQDIRGGIDTRHGAGECGDTDYESVKLYLSRHPSIQIYKGRVQDNADQVAALPFHFVHLDVDIYAVTEYSLEFFGPRLAVGGTIVVDDYGFASCPGVKRSVDEFVERHPEFSGQHLLSGQFMLVKCQA